MFKLFNLRSFVTEIVLDLLHPVRRELIQLESRVGQRVLALEEAGKAKAAPKPVKKPVKKPARKK